MPAISYDNRYFTNDEADAYWEQHQEEIKALLQAAEKAKRDKQRAQELEYLASSVGLWHEPQPTATSLTTWQMVKDLQAKIRAIEDGQIVRGSAAPEPAPLVLSPGVRGIRI